MSSLPPAREPRNIFYLLLLVSSFLFMVTALATALLPVMEDMATRAGNPPPRSEFRAALRRDGWQWLLYEVVAVIVFGLLSMLLDRLRRLKKERGAGTIPPVPNNPSSPD